MIRALVIDDSRLARQELQLLLKNDNRVEVKGEAENSEQAREMIEAHDPDLLFLDIQMPGGSGFDLLESLDATPAVIFTTAYDEYAIRAFEVNALDYLQKPISRERLEDALNTALERIKPADVTDSGRLSIEDQVFVRDGEQCWFVELAEISLMQIEGNNTRIRFDNQKPLITKSLNYMEERLDPKYFFRANRQQIINLKWIKKIDPWFSGSIRVTLKNDVVIDVSRRQTARFKEIMSF